MEITKICRTCLSTNFEIKDVYSIEKVDSRNFVQVLLECTTVQITGNDILPKKICVVCIEYIKNYYKFRQKCIESQEKLFNRLKHLYNSESVFTHKIKDIETSDDHEVKNTNKCPVKIGNLKIDPLEECSKSDIENTAKNNNKYPEFINTLESTEKINDKQFLNEQFSFGAVEFKTEIKSESEDEDEYIDNTSNNVLNDETYLQDTFFEIDQSNKKNPSCISCKKSFASGYNLKRHIQEVHVKNFQYLCHICSKLLKSQSAWTYHMMSHQPETARNFVCTKCNKRFILSTSYKRHMSVHTEIKKFTCHMCPARFKYKFGCIKHINTVHSDKTYSCKLCHKSFNRADNLKQHVKIHTGERPHVCNICGKDFLYIQVLRSHLKTHKANK